MDKKKKILLIIGIIVIIAAIIVAILISLKNNYNFTDADYFEEKDKKGKIEYNIEDERNRVSYYTVENCINTYISYINNKEYTKAFNILSKGYKTNNETTESELKNQIYLDGKFITTEMQELKSYYNAQYRVKGYIINNDKKEYYFFKVKLYQENCTFEIEPCNTKELEDIALIEDESGIELNSDNKYKYASVTQEDMARKYYRYINDLELTSPKEAYELLDSEYKEKRFDNNYDNYLQYINDNKETLQNAAVSEYNLKTGDEINTYTIKDSRENHYIIKEESIMKFKLQLDAYTIQSDEIKEKYNNFTDEEKSTYNLATFIQMINTKDYSNAYNKLSEGFKSNYFKSENDFRNYIKSNMPSEYSCEINNTNEESSIFIFDTTLTYPDGKYTNEMDKTFNIKLKDDGFEVSFEVE